MGFRMRKSIKVAPGVRVNVSKRGVGASVGGKGGRYSVHSSGRRTIYSQDSTSLVCPSRISYQIRPSVLSVKNCTTYRGVKN